jgi:hypothetical protein
MENESKFNYKLTPEEIQFEIEKVKDFFEQIPDELKPGTAVKLIGNIAIWSAFNMFEGIGILEEATLQYRECSVRAEHLFHEQEAEQAAIDSVKTYTCMKDFEAEDILIEQGETVQIGYAGEDSKFEGGKRYILIMEEVYIDLCQSALDTYFAIEEQ